MTGKALLLLSQIDGEKKLCYLHAHGNPGNARKLFLILNIHNLINMKYDDFFVELLSEQLGMIK